MTRRRICVLTGTRAEYGLLRWTMSEIAKDLDLELQVIATGSHLEPTYGMTVDAIEKDGFVVDARVPMNLVDSSSVGVARSLAAAVSGVAEALARLRPDILVLLGDRYEVHGAATAALVTRVPIAHLHGGEATEGVIDEAIRHAVTKMAHLHFVSAQAYRDRVVQLGESPDRVFVVGAAGLDGIERLPLVDRAAVESAIGFALGDGFLMLTYHPETLRAGDGARTTQSLLDALDAFPDRRILLTGTNADPGGDDVRRLLTRYAESNPQRVCLRESLGQMLYLSAVKASAAVVGNSSSGLIEAPSLGVPTVNIGDRQRGRLRAASVIDSPTTRDAIIDALEKALDPSFAQLARSTVNPYGRPGAAAKIHRVLREHPLEGILLKRFRDL